MYPSQDIAIVDIDNNLELRQTVPNLEDLPVFDSNVDAIRNYFSDNPVYHFYHDQVVANCQLFAEYFPGDVLYAVKANDNPLLLRHLIAQGIKSFDVASLYEVELIYNLCQDAELFFMNPVKSFSGIAEAYYKFGVRNFVLDTDFELEKILKATQNAKDLHLFVRLAVSNEFAVLDLGTKFGVSIADIEDILTKVNQHAAQVSICFHIGSQCVNPEAYVRALKQVHQLIAKLPFKISAIDIGGGFPANYNDQSPSPLYLHLKTIQEAIHELKLTEMTRLLAEPGRALVADCYSLVVKILGKKGQELYINDGVYGGLVELDFVNFALPVTHCMNQDKVLSTEYSDFVLWGPSCDSCDRLQRLISLPNNIDIGDLVEFRYAGAYSQVLRNNFNGFYAFDQIYIKNLY